MNFEKNQVSEYVKISSGKANDFKIYANVCAFFMSQWRMSLLVSSEQLRLHLILWNTFAECQTQFSYFVFFRILRENALCQIQVIKYTVNNTNAKQVSHLRCKMLKTLLPIKVLVYREIRLCAIFWIKQLQFAKSGNFSS